MDTLFDRYNSGIMMDTKINRALKLESPYDNGEKYISPVESIRLEDKAALCP